MNIGIIGFGKMGQTRADTISKTGRGKLVKVFDPASTSETKEFTISPSAEDIINDPDIPAVFICTPNI